MHLAPRLRSKTGEGGGSEQTMDALVAVPAPLRTEPQMPASAVPGLGLRQTLRQIHHYSVRVASVVNLDLKIRKPESASRARATRHGILSRHQCSMLES
jgi:hypothetical protein